jgi:hypothetical protein
VEDVPHFLVVRAASLGPSIVSGVFIVIVCVLACVQPCAASYPAPDTSRHHRLQCSAVTVTITNVIKVVAGRFRPNALAYCDYLGYRTAIATGDLTDYLNKTQDLQLGNISNCQASSGDIIDAQVRATSG